MEQSRKIRPFEAKYKIDNHIDRDALTMTQGSFTSDRALQKIRVENVLENEMKPVLPWPTPRWM